jgi:acetyl-CoA acetyltransferase
VRTAIGEFGGSLKDFAPTDLGARVVREALSHASVPGDEVGHVVFGNVVHSEPRDMYLARVAAINGGVAQYTPTLTVTACADPACRRSSRRRNASCWATPTSQSAAVQKA